MSFRVVKIPSEFENWLQGWKFWLRAKKIASEFEKKNWTKNVQNQNSQFQSFLRIETPFFRVKNGLQNFSSCDNFFVVSNNRFHVLSPLRPQVKKKKKLTYLMTRDGKFSGSTASNTAWLMGDCFSTIGYYSCHYCYY